MKRSPLFLFLALSFIISCLPKEQPITEKEALDFAQKLELSVAKKSSNILDSIFMCLYLPGGLPTNQVKLIMSNLLEKCQAPY